jgi:hypothetical protein
MHRNTSSNACITHVPMALNDRKFGRIGNYKPAEIVSHLLNFSILVCPLREYFKTSFSQMTHTSFKILDSPGFVINETFDLVTCSADPDSSSEDRTSLLYKTLLWQTSDNRVLQLTI